MLSTALPVSCFILLFRGPKSLKFLPAVCISLSPTIPPTLQPSLSLLLLSLLHHFYSSHSPTHSPLPLIHLPLLFTLSHTSLPVPISLFLLFPTLFPPLSSLPYPTLPFHISSPYHLSSPLTTQVKLARDEENCALVIVVWSPVTVEGAAFSVENSSDVAVSVTQKGVFAPPVPSRSTQIPILLPLVFPYFLFSFPLLLPHSLFTLLYTASLFSLISPHLSLLSSPLSLHYSPSSPLPLIQLSYCSLLSLLISSLYLATEE